MTCKGCCATTFAMSTISVIAPTLLTAIKVANIPIMKALGPNDCDRIPMHDDPQRRVGAGECSSEEKTVGTAQPRWHGWQQQGHAGCSRTDPDYLRVGCDRAD